MHICVRPIWWEPMSGTSTPVLSIPKQQQCHRLSTENFGCCRLLKKCKAACDMTTDLVFCLIFFPSLMQNMNDKHHAKVKMPSHPLALHMPLPLLSLGHLPGHVCVLPCPCATTQRMCKQCPVLLDAWLNHLHARACLWQLGCLQSVAGSTFCKSYPACTTLLTGRLHAIERQYSENYMSQKLQALC